MAKVEREYVVDFKKYDRLKQYLESEVEEGNADMIFNRLVGGARVCILYYLSSAINLSYNMSSDNKLNLKVYKEEEEEAKEVLGILERVLLDDR